MKNRFTAQFIYRLTSFMLLGALMFAVLGCSKNRGDQVTVRPVAVRVVKPMVKDMENRLSYMGTVRADREVRVIAQVQGTVVSLPKPEGVPIAKGDLVAAIDVPDIRATVERIQADRDYWQHRYEADKRLVALEALPSEQMEVSLHAYRNAKAGLAEAEAKLAKAKEFSTINGQVLSWLVEPGQHVMPGQPILLLGDNALEIHVEVVEEDLHRGVKVGTPVEVNDWQGHAFFSTVSEVAPAASGPARTFTVKLTVPKEEAKDLRIGASMKVNFKLQTSANSVVVPVQAITKVDGKTSIFLIQQDSAKKQSVTTGIEQEGLIEVTFQWNGEDRVAVSNLGNLDDGVPVFPVEVRTNRRIE